MEKGEKIMKKILIIVLVFTCCVLNSRSYYNHYNYYMMKSTRTFYLIPYFQTYQQKTEYTCAPASVKMVLKYFGCDYKEEDLAAEMGTTEDNGTDIYQVVEYLKKNNWDYMSTIENGKIKLSDIRKSIKNGYPVLVDWVDWGGHWEVIIGYDTMGTAKESDDVLIFADPYDTSDHCQDGYYVFPAERFYWMWLTVSPNHPSDEKNNLYIIVRGRK